MRVGVEGGKWWSVGKVYMCGGRDSMEMAQAECQRLGYWAMGDIRRKYDVEKREDEVRE